MKSIANSCCLHSVLVVLMILILVLNLIETIATWQIFPRIEKLEAGLSQLAKMQSQQK